MKANYDDAISVVRRLMECGHHAYLAGGCVRDTLLSLTPNDYDIATSATPEEVQATFSRTVPVGASFGVVKVVTEEGRELDVATFRTDGIYSDNRRPDSVVYNREAKEDVKRRDFTINALLMGPDGNVIDHVGGQEDLKNRLLRTVGDAHERFQEDALRMMRAIRFAVRFNLEIDPDTWEAIRLLKDTISSVSKERVTDELTKTFSYGKCDRAYLLLRRSGLWKSWFNGRPDADDSWRTLYALSHVQPGDPFILTLEIILAECWSGDRDRHLERLVFTNVQKKALSSLHDGKSHVQNFLSKSLAEQRKIMQWEDLALMMKFLDYEKETKKFEYNLGYQQTFEVVASRMEEVKAMGWPGPLVTGNDLIEMGFVAGPVFTNMLELVRTEQLDGRLLDKDAVKPFLISKFPATPRWLEDGTSFDDMHYRRLIAACPSCQQQMSVNVAKDAEGHLLWGGAKDFMNVRSWSTNHFFMCGQCGGKKKKTAFVEAVI